MNMCLTHIKVGTPTNLKVRRKVLVERKVVMMRQQLLLQKEQIVQVSLQTKIQ
ncbi:hypothetical protein DPMN_162529 [Dreissena polymorpha]|uniref:Uncharacterized protein n=1 Tax=Dreissena polymorpha TaxID=45954 RepID=A0A9D4EQQ3_DREPO|nr:hypothetical protein DPMN_162529 [Dreissena polymorpha]